MTNIPFYQVDAFSERPFSGNPAAICLLQQELPAEVMQQIAMENNLAETAFVLKTPQDYQLRWFTPTVEIKLCGHATLASAHILWEQGILPQQETARFHTKSGLLTVTRKEEWIQLDFPAFSCQAAAVPDEAMQALQITPVQTSMANDGRYIIEVATESEVLSAAPDFSILKHYEAMVVTSKGSGSSPYDFISRSFAPSHGVDEDAVTGSSHCALAPYWAEKLGKTRFFARQASARGGELRVEQAGERVLIEGKAVTVIEGVLKLHA